MIRLGHIRRSPHLIRSVFAVFALAWLQMAAVPCAMAGTMQAASLSSVDSQRGMSDEIQQESPGMSMSDVADGHHDCIYCPPSAGSDPETSPANCLFPDQPQTDRGGHTPVWHGMLVAVPDLRSFDSVIQRHPPPTLIRAAPPQPRPLNLTYCVQLK